MQCDEGRRSRDRDGDKLLVVVPCVPFHLEALTDCHDRCTIRDSPTAVAGPLIYVLLTRAPNHLIRFNIIFPALSRSPNAPTNTYIFSQEHVDQGFCNHMVAEIHVDAAAKISDPEYPCHETSDKDRSAVAPSRLPRKRGRRTPSTSSWSPLM